MDNQDTYWESRIGRRLRLRDLRVLSAVVQWGSMAKAAKHLAMSQPAVSEAVSSLEGVIGARLLDRSAQGIEATIYARALLKRGQAVFDELRQGIRDIEFLANPNSGEVRVASPETISATLLPAVIENLSVHYPKVDVRVIDANPRVLDFRDLRERNVDLMLVRLPPSFELDDLDTEILFEDPHRVVVGASSRLARRRKVTLADLVQERWIIPHNMALDELLTEAFKNQALKIPHVTVSTGSLLLRKHLLATGRFVTVLPDSVARLYSREWLLKPLSLDLGVAPQPIALLALKNRTVSPVVGLFVQQLRQVAKMMAAQPRAR